MKTACISRLAFLNRILIGLAFYAAGIVLALAPMSSAVAGDNAAAELSVSLPAQATGGTWTSTGDLGTPRDYHRATLLPNDEVLVTGGERIYVGRLGYVFESKKSAQLYRPAIGGWQRIANMNHTHNGHTATLLPNGQVLVAGGTPGGLAELYDPTTRTWMDTGSLGTTRWYHTATLLPNGQVLVTGGMTANFRGPHETVASAELYDPATGVWTPTGSMTTARSFHTATLLPNGQVLVTGYSNTAELYDPATGVWTPTGSMATARSFYTATLLPNGQVLVAGGTWLASAELYDPATGVWTATGSMTTARGIHTATLLPNGQVLVAGGFDGTDYLATSELYDPATAMWTATDNMAIARCFHTATLLPNGQVLVAGGEGDGVVSLTGAELYQSATGVFDIQYRGIETTL
jgi:hypothetical protein